jgi:serine/threonine protein kinase
MPAVDAERWRKVNEVFHAALEHDGQGRASFLDDACADDVELRREVESLLRSHADAGDFIESPAYEAGAELLHGDPRAGVATSLIGRRVGPYVIEASLGHGGMGVVYLAEDTRLDRKVAIKALAHHLGRDQRSRERLRREAKAAAALSHPGIATVFALEEFDDQLYIVYEYADGPTLREEMEAGPVATETLLGTALAVGRALQAAHDLGIVHRDLKPENIIRTRDGGIKILDFGLASLPQSPLAQADSGSGEIRLTLPGMLLGTPSYMSPEQLKGRDVDFRSDLFSFGVVLYEMASGTHPFEGADPASTIARILEVEPRRLDDELRTNLPEIEPLLRRLLSKAPEDRYRNTAELVADLERLANGMSPAAAQERVGSPHPGADPGDRHDAFWWWRFHQFALSVVYAVCCYGAWLAWRWSPEAGGILPGGVLFYAIVVLAIVAGSMRLHLAFAARYYPTELRAQLQRAMPRIQLAELLCALLLFGSALLVGRVDTYPTMLLAALLMAVAGGILVFARVIEPTTRRAAFPPP